MRHSRFYRLVCGVLLVTFVASSTDVLLAQTQTTPAPGTATAAGTAAEGQRDGEMLADTVGTGGKAGLGVVVGLFTGLIGTGIGYAVIGPKELSADAALAQQSKSQEYQTGFKSGWAKTTKDKKRKSFLVGGLLGTAAWVALLVSANSGDEY